MRGARRGGEQACVERCRRGRYVAAAITARDCEVAHPAVALRPAAGRRFLTLVRFCARLVIVNTGKPIIKCAGCAAGAPPAVSAAVSVFPTLIPPQCQQLAARQHQCLCDQLRTACQLTAARSQGPPVGALQLRSNQAQGLQWQAAQAAAAGHRKF